jgi:hypothetical protein
MIIDSNKFPSSPELKQGQSQGIWKVVGRDALVGFGTGL